MPKGAKNIDGAIEFINLNRMYDIDPAIQAKVREDHINPQKIYFEKGKYAGSEKWQMKWGERELRPVARDVRPIQLHVHQRGRRGLLH